MTVLLWVILAVLYAGLALPAYGRSVNEDPAAHFCESAAGSANEGD